MASFAYDNKGVIPDTFNPDDLFIYFSSLADNNSAIKINGIIKKNLVEALESGESGYGTLGEKLKVGSSSSAMDDAIKFLEKAAKAERAKELKVLQILEEDILDKINQLETLKRYDKYTGREKANKALRKIKSAYEALRPALKGDTMAYGLDFYAKVTTLFNAYSQSAEDFASEMSDMFLRNDDGSFVEGTVSSKFSSADSKKEAEKRGILFSSVAEFSAGSIMSGILGRITNHGRESKKKAFADFIIDEIINFFEESSGKLEMKMTIERFIALVAILNIEMTKKIQREFSNKMNESGKISKISKATLVKDMEYFLENYVNSINEEDNEKEYTSLGKHYAASKEGIMALTPKQLENYVDSMVKFLSIENISNIKVEEIKKRRPQQRRSERKDTKDILNKLRQLGIIDDKTADKDLIKALSEMTYRTDFNSNQFNGELMERIVAAGQAAVNSSSKIRTGGVKVGGHAATDVITVGAICVNTSSLDKHLKKESLAIEKYNNVMNQAIEFYDKDKTLSKIALEDSSETGSATKQLIQAQKQEYKRMQEEILESYKNAQNRNDRPLTEGKYFTFSQTVKTYSSAIKNSSTEKRKKGFQHFEGRELNFKNFISELLVVVDMAGSALNVEDANLLISAALNSRSGAWLGDGYKSTLEAYFAQFMSILMFSDAGLIARDAAVKLNDLTKSDNLRIHLYTLNKNYVPASMILQGVADRSKEALKKIISFDKGSLERVTNVRANIRVGPQFSTLEAISQNPAYQPYNRRWSVVSEKALYETKITMTFMRGFLTLIDKIFNMEST